ncbi:MAG: glycosyltransferase family 9 protein [Candidatus Hydrogenedentes bacterium]|nr:glycosyltransferase family 9 protein [Candidatus Hydrogenedentota bacterium]
MLNGIPRILIVRLSAIGDVVRVVPALQCLREAFPDAQIDWVVEPKSFDVISGHPALDNVILFERSEHALASARALWNTCEQVRKNRYEIVIDFHGIFKSGLITARSGAPDRYGFARPRSREGNFLFTNHKARLGPEVVNRLHENLALCNELSPGTKSLDVTLHVPEEIQEDVEAFFEETFDGAKRIVAMHVPMDRDEKRWPIEYYAELADELLSDGRFEVVLTWGPGQLSEAQNVAKLCKRSPAIAPEMSSLKHYLWFIQCAHLYVGGDTGPMHIASAMGTPAVIIFGGTNPEQHEPLRKPYRVLIADDVAPKTSAPERLRSISPDRVYTACVDLCAS